MHGHVVAGFGASKQAKARNAAAGGGDATAAAGEPKTFFKLGKRDDSLCRWQEVAMRGQRGLTIDVVPAVSTNGSTHSPSATHGNYLKLAGKHSLAPSLCTVTDTRHVQTLTCTAKCSLPGTGP